MNYYNEFDPKAAAWLRELISEGLIPYGTVDERSITEVSPTDLAGFTQCHFFAGIGGWPYALRLAGWPDTHPVWTGSCPCQPFSCAGKGLATADERHLWPVFRELIRACKPPTVFGEQVASKAGREWLSSVRSDLGGMGYEFGAAGLCAYSVNAPHERLRSFWVAHSAVNGCEGIQRKAVSQVSQDGAFETLDAWHGTGNPFEQWPKLLAESRVCRLDDGVSSGLVVRPALRGYGNAIVPQLAAEFILASLDAIADDGGKT